MNRRELLRNLGIGAAALLVPVAGIKAAQAIVNPTHDSLHEAKHFMVELVACRDGERCHLILDGGPAAYWLAGSGRRLLRKAPVVYAAAEVVAIDAIRVWKPYEAGWELMAEDRFPPVNMIPGDSFSVRFQ